MTLTLLALLVGLALADSLNPFTIAAQAWLLGTPRPFPRSMAFLLGTAAAVFAAGMLLLRSWDVVRARAISVLPAWTWGAAEIVLGLVVAAFACWSWGRAADGKAWTPPQALGVAATFGFALASAVSDLPTAFPLFVAADRVVAADLAGTAETALIAAYALVYTAPLIALIGMRAAFGQRSDALFSKMQSVVDWTFRVLLPPAAALGAAYLLIDGVLRLAAVLPVPLVVGV